MQLADPLTTAGWRAQLALRFERRGERTVLAKRRHDGPLVVQKALYPEGEDVCHAIVVHPPGGIAGGDALEIALDVPEGAHAVLTTPGAAKWYRTAGPWASQKLGFAVQGSLEWLPQETIVFDGALADMNCAVDLAGEAGYIGWEIFCLGRTGSGERYSRGTCRVATEIRRDGRPLLFERARIEGAEAFLESPVGLSGQPVFGCLYASSPRLEASLLAPCREHRPEQGEGAVTLLPGVLVARYRGASCEAARKYFGKLWALLRPALLAKEACEPRIWRT